MADVESGSSVDLAFLGCLGASLIGLALSTLWVITAPSSASSLGILFLLGGVGVCYLGLLVRGDDRSGTGSREP
jgi:hypothetical protein